MARFLGNTIYGAALAGIAVGAGSLLLTAALAQSAVVVPPKSDKLEEIIVTAQKRVEDLQTVPISAQVISSQTLAEQNYNSLQDLTEMVPAVHIGSNELANDLFIRGIGNDETGSGGGSSLFNQSVATFVDDIFHGRSRTSDATFLDLDRIEILKGPQSTFFGNNAIAGALNIVTKQPGDTFTGDVRALYGMFGQYALEGAVTLPVNDMLSVRIAAMENGMSGWANNINTGEKDPKEHDQAARMTVLFKPTEDLDATLKIEGSRNSSSLSPQFWVNCPPPAPRTPANPASGCNSALAEGVPLGLKTNDTANLPGNELRLSTVDTVLTLNYRHWDQVFTSVTGYTDYNYFQHFANQPLTDVNDSATDVIPESYHQFSQEFRVASNPGGRFEYLAGVYFQTDGLHSSATIVDPLLTPLVSGLYAALSPFFPGAPPLAPYLPLASIADDSQTEKVYSIFGSLGWNITEQLRLNAGLRGSETKLTDNTSGGLGYDSSPFGPWTPLPPAVLAVLGPVFGATLLPSAADTAEVTEHAWMPSADLQYKFSPDVMAYLTYRQGFKAGGFNGKSALVPSVQAGYGPEHVNDYEMGVKSKWFDDRVLLNVNVFRENYRDLQVQGAAINAATNSYYPVTSNAAKALSQGVELEAAWVISSALRLKADVTYLNAYYTSYRNGPETQLQSFCGSSGSYVLPYCAAYPAPPAPVPIFTDRTGYRLAYAPLWSGSLTGSYTVMLPGGFPLTTSLIPFFTSRYNQEDPLVVGTDAYVRLDARVTLQSPDARWAVDLIGKNLTDRTIVTSFNAVENVTKEEPRNAVIQVRYKW